MTDPAPILRLLLLLFALLAPGWAAACPTCGTASMPGLAAVDLGANYPLQYRRSGARLTLSGASDRVLRTGAPPRSRLLLFVADEGFAPRRVAAGFSWERDALGLHVCGPEITLSLSLP